MDGVGGGNEAGERVVIPASIGVLLFQEGVDTAFDGGVLIGEAKGLKRCQGESGWCGIGINRICGTCRIEAPRAVWLLQFAEAFGIGCDLRLGAVPE